MAHAQASCVLLEMNGKRLSHARRCKSIISYLEDDEIMNRREVREEVVARAKELLDEDRLEDAAKLLLYESILAQGKAFQIVELYACGLAAKQLKTKKIDKDNIAQFALEVVQQAQRDANIELSTPDQALIIESLGKAIELNAERYMK